MFQDYSPQTRPENEFIDYWESLGFFDNIQLVLPPDFFVLFDIARLIFSDDTNDAFKAVEDITQKEKVYEPMRDETIKVNRIERSAPLGDKMELGFFKKITELKKCPPRELAQDDEVFNLKLFTKTLMVQKFFESEADSFKPISTSRNESGKDANRFEQKFYILLDRSRSMDMKMRSFYSKCIVAEFLRRKMQSKAKLFYRAFDSSTGALYKVEKPEDFPGLIEKVLLTTTGGASTNLQGAIYQAISDIQYDKDTTKAEILVVTDGISKIEKNELKLKLGLIRLNVLKIGEDPSEPDYFELEGFLKAENMDVDPKTFNVKDIQRNAGKDRNLKNPLMQNKESRVSRIICDFSEKIFKDLKDVSYKYIEIRDLHAEGLYDVDDKKIESLEKSIKRFQGINLDNMIPENKKKIYKQVYLLLQYVSMLLDNNAADPRLKTLYDALTDLKAQLMKDPDIIYTLMKSKDFDEDKKTMKLAKKEMKKLMKGVQLDKKDLTIDDMKRADVFFNMDPGGEGNMGKFVLLILIKLYQFIKRIILYPFKRDEADRKKS